MPVDRIHFKTFGREHEENINKADLHLVRDHQLNNVDPGDAGSVEMRPNCQKTYPGAQVTLRMC